MFDWSTEQSILVSVGLMTLSQLLLLVCWCLETSALKLY